jgi:hypothetical protein
MTMNIGDKQFTSEQIADAAGVQPGTFRKWRNRNLLFAQTVDGTNEHKRFSLLDAAVLRAVMILSRYMQIEFAVMFAEGRVRARIKALLDGRDVPVRVGFELHDIWNGQPEFSDDPGDTVDELLNGTKGEIVLIDVRTRIIDPVCKALEAPKP